MDHSRLRRASAPGGSDNFPGYAIVKVYRSQLLSEAPSVEFQANEIEAVKWANRWELGIICQDFEITPALLYFTRLAADRGWLL